MIRVFTFASGHIWHRNMLLQRESACRLLALFEADGSWAEELAGQLRQAIEQHDQHWREKAA